MTTTHGSCFSGSGILDRTVEMLFDAQTIWQIDNDPDASLVLGHHWPHVPNLGDISAVDWSSVPRVDVLSGGFPCTDVSLAAVDRRAGLSDGTRSALWSHMAIAIEALRPSLVVIENVKGLLSAEAIRRRDVESGTAALGDQPTLRAAGAVIGDLASIGYDAQWITTNSAHLGAAHARHRVFVVAHPAGQPPGLPEHWTQSFRAFSTDGMKLLPTPSASDGIGGGPNDPVNRLARGHQVQLIDLGMRPDVWARYDAAITRWEQLSVPAPEPTEPTKRGKYGCRLNAKFDEWLMGWPVGWVTDIEGIGRKPQLRIIGNGVMPQQVWTAVSSLMQVAVAA